MYIHPLVFHPISWTLWNLSTYLTILDLHQRSNNRRYFLQNCIQRCTRSPGHVDVFQWKRKWCFSRHVQFDSGFNVMAENEVSWHGPEIISLLHHHTTMSLEMVLLKTRLVLLEDFIVLLLDLGRSQIKEDVLRTWCPPESFTVPSAIGNMKFSPFMGVNTSFALSLFAWIPDASISSNSLMSATMMSPFQIPPAYRAYPRNNPGKTFFPNWWILDWSFAELG